jgi:hypothetical protein
MIKAIIVSALMLSSYSLHAAQRLDMSLPECLSVEESFKDGRHYDYRLGINRKADKIFTVNCNGPKFYVLIENIAEFRARTGYTKEHFLDSPAAKARADELIQQQVRLMLRVGQ